MKIQHSVCPFKVTIVFTYTIINIKQMVKILWRNFQVKILTIFDLLLPSNHVFQTTTINHNCAYACRLANIASKNKSIFLVIFLTDHSKKTQPLSRTALNKNVRTIVIEGLTQSCCWSEKSSKFFFSLKGK